jgi:hypothetical protein
LIANRVLVSGSLDTCLFSYTLYYLSSFYIIIFIQYLNFIRFHILKYERCLILFFLFFAVFLFTCSDARLAGAGVHAILPARTEQDGRGGEG